MQWVGILPNMTDASRTAMFRFAVLVLALGILVVFSPRISRAQTAPPSDLRSVIRAQLLSDPRTASLSSDQLDAMVSLLAQQAQKQGITAQDITWRPQAPAPASAPRAPAESCAGNFTCVMDEAFGFIGPDTTIPFALGAASMGLIWITAEMLHRRKYPHVPAQSASATGV